MSRLLTLVFLFPICLFAQLNVDRTSIDFGQIALFNNDTAFFTFTNTGTKTIYLLPTQPKDDYSILCSSKTIEPGSSISIGIVYYTDKKGKFAIDVPLSFSHSGTPILLTVKGNIKAIHETAFTKCPSIEDSKPLQAAQIPLNIVVRDSKTLEFLSADVKVNASRYTYNCVAGIGSKNYKCNCRYGPLTLTVNKKGYHPHAQDYIYDPEHYTILVDLVQFEMDTQTQPRKPVDIHKPDNPKRIQEKDSFIPDYVYIPASQDSGFLSYKYKPNHLIFIIDISGSMKDSTKLNFLKKSMGQLILSARPQDHITLITYAYKVKVVFENYSGLDRTAMLTAIDTLQAAGGSNGAQSLMMAYDLAKSYFIKNGNNQIFLATDGLFNSSKISDDDLYKLTRKGFNTHGIKLSTIGFGRDEKALEFLQKLARLGHGNFLTISNTGSDIDVLLNEVKLQSLTTN